MKRPADLKVLVVDDMRPDRTLLKQLLKKLGCQHVDEASDELEAADLTATMRYDVVFLDWNLPNKTGLEILRKYRVDKDYDDTAFVMFSGESESRYLIEALRTGATSYIVKPVDETAVRAHVAEVLEWLNLKKLLSR
jgi:two-component system, chemotaxis family, chemotaxis protein CheY